LGGNRSEQRTEDTHESERGILGAPSDFLAKAFFRGIMRQQIRKFQYSKELCIKDPKVPPFIHTGL